MRSLMITPLWQNGVVYIWMNECVCLVPIGLGIVLDGFLDEVPGVIYVVVRHDA